jgi:quercetin dioxygenase-like cupin family protein
MAYPNKVIRNTKTGQDIRFIKTGKETNGELLEMEASFTPHSIEPAAHYHPRQTEDFTVLAGALTVRLNGKVTVLKAGDSLHIPSSAVHAMWNSSNQKTIVNWKVKPALNTDHLLETGVGLANDTDTTEKGMPGVLQMALLAQRFSDVYRLAKPPYVVQRVLFAVLTPFAYLAGYRAEYKKYID